MKKEYKNVIKLGLIIAVSLMAVFYLRGLYKNYKDYQLSIPVIVDVFREIKKDEVDNYILENPTTLLYACTSHEDKCRSFEQDLKKYVIKNNLREKVVYLNLNDIKSTDLIDHIKKQFEYDRKIKTYPFMIYFKEGKIIDHLDSSNKQLMSISLFEDFIKMYEIGYTNE